jgi:hypothetical protein
MPANVQGVDYSFASLTARLDGAEVYTGFKSIDWEDGKEVGEFVGNNGQVIGKTGGIYKVESFNFSLAKWQSQTFLKRLGNGYLSKRFDAHLVYREFNMPVNERLIVGAEIMKIKESQEEGVDVLVDEYTCGAFYVLRDGMVPMRKFLQF